MNQVPARKYSGDLLNLKQINKDNVQKNKIYYIRVRNKDKGKNIRGLKKDYIGKINLIDDTGISFDIIFSRYADPRDGKPIWKKEDTRMLILKEALIKKDKNDNTMFFIDDTLKTKNTTRSILKRLFGLRMTQRKSVRV